MRECLSQVCTHVRAFMRTADTAIHQERQSCGEPHNQLNTHGLLAYFAIDCLCALQIPPYIRRDNPAENPIITLNTHGLLAYLTIGCR